jgi:hypothetical protein
MRRCHRRCICLHWLRNPRYIPRSRSRLRCRQRHGHCRCRGLWCESRTPPKMGRGKSSFTTHQRDNGQTGKWLGLGRRGERRYTIITIYELCQHASHGRVASSRDATTVAVSLSYRDLVGTIATCVTSTWTALFASPCTRLASTGSPT